MQNLVRCCKTFQLDFKVIGLQGACATDDDDDDG